MQHLQHFATFCNILQHLQEFCNICKDFATFATKLQHFKDIYIINNQIVNYIVAHVANVAEKKHTRVRKFFFRLKMGKF